MARRISTRKRATGPLRPRPSARAARCPSARRACTPAPRRLRPRRPPAPAARARRRAAPASAPPRRCAAPAAIAPRRRARGQTGAPPRRQSSHSPHGSIGPASTRRSDQPAAPRAGGDHAADRGHALRGVLRRPRPRARRHRRQRRCGAPRSPAAAPRPRRPAPARPAYRSPSTRPPHRRRTPSRLPVDARLLESFFIDIDRLRRDRNRARLAARRRGGGGWLGRRGRRRRLGGGRVHEAARSGRPYRERALASAATRSSYGIMPARVTRGVAAPQLDPAQTAGRVAAPHGPDRLAHRPPDPAAPLARDPRRLRPRLPGRAGRRLDGSPRSSLNLGFPLGEATARYVEENRRRLLAGTPATIRPAAPGHASTSTAPPAGAIGEPLADDAEFLTMIGRCDQVGPVLGAFAADCIPILFAEPGGASRRGLRTAGWRGAPWPAWRATSSAAWSSAGREGRAACASRSGRLPHRPRAASRSAPRWWPSSAPRSASYRGWSSPGRPRTTSNRVATRAILEEAGVSPEHIDDQAAVHALGTGRFFSYRRDGIAGGVHMAFIRMVQSGCRLSRRPPSSG